jgi:hypothetical protein
LRISDTVPTTRTGTRAIRSVSGVMVPGARMCREIVPPSALATLMSWFSTCSALILMWPSSPSDSECSCSPRAWPSAFPAEGLPWSWPSSAVSAGPLAGSLAGALVAGPAAYVTIDGGTPTAVRRPRTKPETAGRVAPAKTPAATRTAVRKMRMMFARPRPCAVRDGAVVDAG